MSEKVGRFEVLRHLARGGMADVFLARIAGPEGFEKLCVLKRLLPHLLTSQEHVRMFLDEARIAGALHHSNIVQVYEVGESDGKYFLAMEYLRGRDLSQVFRALSARDRRMPLEQAIHVVASICAGLHYAHEASDPQGRKMGLVHRDISPQNIFITFDGHVKLMDFGIAKVADQKTQTRKGVLKGKLAYMAPEQARGKTVDRRTDIYAAGVMLWELTTGKRLHSHSDDYEMMKSVVEIDAPSPSSIISDYPRQLEAICLRALARSAEDRTSNADELLNELESFARDQKMTMSPSGLAALMVELFPAEKEPPISAFSKNEGTLIEETTEDSEGEAGLSHMPSLVVPSDGIVAKTEERTPGRAKRGRVLAALGICGAVAIATGLGWMAIRGNARQIPNAIPSARLASAATVSAAAMSAESAAFQVSPETSSKEPSVPTTAASAPRGRSNNCVGGPGSAQSCPGAASVLKAPKAKAKPAIDYDSPLPP